MKHTEVTVTINGKPSLIVWFKYRDEVDVFLGIVEQVWESEFHEGQLLTDRDLEGLIESL